MIGGLTLPEPFRQLPIGWTFLPCSILRLTTVCLTVHLHLLNSCPDRTRTILSQAGETTKTTARMPVFLALVSKIHQIYHLQSATVPSTAKIPIRPNSRRSSLQTLLLVCKIWPTIPLQICHYPPSRMYLSILRLIQEIMGYFQGTTGKLDPIELPSWQKPVGLRRRRRSKVVEEFPNS
jgi:hypothetical protein